MPSPRPRPRPSEVALKPLEETVMTGPSALDRPLETLDKERVLHPATSIADHLARARASWPRGPGSP